MNENKAQKNGLKLDHLNFTVNSFAETAEWYKKIFGFEIVEQGLNESKKPWGILRNGDAMLAITENDKKKVDESDEFHRIYHFGLRITDKEDWEQKLKEYKLKTYFGTPVRYPHSYSWYVKDPTGNTIEVVHWDDDEIRFS